MLCVYTLEQQQRQQQLKTEDEELYEEMMVETADAFQRHMNMLLPFYSDMAHMLPPSDMQLELQCLQLLHFLSGDCIAELHVAYDRLSEELTKTVRLLIAATLEAAYDSLSISYVARVLQLPAPSLGAFCEEQNKRRRQREAQDLMSSPSMEFAAVAAADAAAAAPRLLQQQQQMQSSISTLAAGVGSGSFASAVSLERSGPLGVRWVIRGDRVVFLKEQHTSQHCAFHSTQVAAHLIGYATELERIV
ncbi:SAC3 family protein [Cyclospora cayetanensis]|uniref:SAC3 family protein n=1 Tax=Cyclospora cayetanensis TaxID=88456 RepID=A0A1D3CYL0_9EIME|nr:SAC3 family protein [Cyclospora cayetanensis]